MNLVAKALWFIESHFADEITLTEIAGVSRFHPVRACGDTRGCSVMRYVLARRPTEAAKTPPKGAPDILMVALDAGYNSHEAFTRACRDEFGFTPESVRADGNVENLILRESVRMDKTSKTTLRPPRMEDGRMLLIAGLEGHFTLENLAGLPALWQRFGDHISNVSGQVGEVAYGVCYNPDDTGGFDYIAGVEVVGFASLPKDFARLRIPEQRYAVFTHTEHISTIRGTFMAIFNDWLPASGYQNAGAPPLERYDERLDPRSGLGGFDIWIPVKR